MIVAGLTLIGLGLRSDGAVGEPADRGSAPPPVVGAAAPSRAAPAGPDPAELARKERQRRVAALDAELKKYAATVPEFSVAVLDARTGERYAYRGAERYENASVVKVQVLACLLLTAQDEDRRLTSTELSRAKLMIKISDNDATTALFRQLGRVSGITACNKRLGLASITVRPSWGLTLTTVNDQVKLLSELVDKKGPLDSRSRKIAFDLMSTVQADQRWGVSAAAAGVEDFTIKNGWLQRSTENGRWIINSIGRITGDDIDVSLAVLSHGHATDGGGKEVVAKIAKLTRKHLKY